LGLTASAEFAFFAKIVATVVPVDYSEIVCGERPAPSVAAFAADIGVPT
jgi:hypothetical protein